MLYRWYILPEKASDLAEFGEDALLTQRAAVVVVQADDARKKVQSCAFDTYPVSDQAFANADKWDDWVAENGDYDTLVAEIQAVFGSPDETD